MSYIWTFGGHRVSLTDPRPEQIRIEDIARALSRICRWGGHACRHYSVAQHSYYVSKLCTREHGLVALCHDAAEAYLGDVASPLKRLLGHDYTDLERHMLGVIGARFGLDLLNLPDCVHHADRLMQLAEASVLLRVPRAELIEHYGELPGVLPHVGHWEPKEAEDMFLARWTDLGGKL